MNEMDKARIVEVDGVKGRLIPLRVRGDDRRKASDFESGEVVSVTVRGVYRPESVSLVIEGQWGDLQAEREPLLPVTVNGTVMLSILPSALARVAERRSGIERRKGGK